MANILGINSEPAKSAGEIKEEDEKRRAATRQGLSDAAVLRARRQGRKSLVSPGLSIPTND